MASTSNSGNSLLNIEKFTGHNYATWAQSIKLVLRNQGVTHRFTANPLTAAEQTNDELVKKIDNEEAKVYSLLGLSVQPKVLQGFGLPETATVKQLWDKIK